MKGGFAGSQSITVSGAKRTFELYVPDAYDGRTTYPLVLVFHGDGGTGAGMRGTLKLEAESQGAAIIVYADGLGKTWQIDGKAALANDVAYVDAVIADVQARTCADKSRTFAVGFSKGAYFANQLACRTKSVLRGVITHAGGGPFGVDGSEYDGSGNLLCPAPAIAALQVQGEADTSVPLGEGQKARDHWRRANQCKTTTQGYDPSPCVSYEGCARPEIWCQIPAMGHTIWPQNGVKVTWAFIQANK